MCFQAGANVPASCFDINYWAVAWIFGGQTASVSRIVYAVVGLAGLWCITLLFRRSRKTEA